MQFQPTLIRARLIRRYKRFLADVRFDNGQELTVHCPNTGSMLGCDAPDSPVWLSRSDNPRRKYAHTWELVEALPGVLVGINTSRTNRLVEEAIESGWIDPLSGYQNLRREVRVGSSRLDFQLSDPGQSDCYVEVKNVTAAVTDRVALFPDAVSDRATRHVQELVQIHQQGHRAVLLFCVQRQDVDCVVPARAIDPTYADAVAAAVSEGVEVLAYRCRMSSAGIELRDSIAFQPG